MNRRHMAFTLPILAALLIFCSPILRSAADQTYEDMKMLIEVMNLVRDNYVQEIETKKLVYGAASGMAARHPGKGMSLFRNTSEPTISAAPVHPAAPFTSVPAGRPNTEK